MCAAPRAPPPPSTRPIFGLARAVPPGAGQAQGRQQCERQGTMEAKHYSCWPGGGLLRMFGLDSTHDMHLAGAAVEFQAQSFVAIHQHHRLGAHLALDAGDALGLLGAQAEGIAQAVLGDHQRHLAGFLVRLVGGGDQLDAVLLVEGARRLVVDVGEEGQRCFRDRRRAARRRPAQRADDRRRGARRSSAATASRRSWLSSESGTKRGSAQSTTRSASSKSVLPSRASCSRRPASAWSACRDG